VKVKAVEDQSGADAEEEEEEDSVIKAMEAGLQKIR